MYMCTYKCILKNQKGLNNDIEKVIIMDTPDELIAYEKARTIVELDDMQNGKGNINIKVEKMKDKNLGFAFYLNKVT